MGSLVRNMLIILGVADLYALHFYMCTQSQPAFTSSKLTIKTPERRQWRLSIVFVNFEPILHLVLVFSS